MNFVTISNHPVHIVDENGKIVSPTALIPFCEFGGNMSIMGVKLEGFQDPVCSSFRPKVFRNQLCYEVDPNEYKKKLGGNNRDTIGLTFLVNFNEDRQTKNESIGTEVAKESRSHTFELEENGDDNVFIGTISINNVLILEN